MEIFNGSNASGDLFIHFEDRHIGGVITIEFMNITYFFVDRNYFRNKIKGSDLIILTDCKYIKLPVNYLGLELPGPLPLTRCYRSIQIKLDKIFISPDGVEWFLKWATGDKEFFSSEMESYVKNSLRNEIYYLKVSIFIYLRNKITSCGCIYHILSFLNLYEVFSDEYEYLKKNFLYTKYPELTEKQVNHFVKKNIRPIESNFINLDQDDEVGENVSSSNSDSDEFDLF